jgi:VanZ family protein
MNQAASDCASHTSRRLIQWGLLTYVLMLTYASLAPFEGWQRPQGYTLFDWPKYVTGFDLAINMVAYLPLGVIVAAALRNPLDDVEFSPRQWPIVLLLSVLTGLAISLSMESVQAFLPSRVSSPLDVLANTIGTSAGAIAMLLPAGRRLIHAMVEFRRSYFSQAPRTDWGLLLLALWLFAQLNPAIPFFEAGMLAEQVPVVTTGVPAAATPYDPLVLWPQAVGVALNVAAFAMFVAMLLPPAQSVALPLALILASGLTAKLAMAALLLKAPQLGSSLSPATVIGVIAGLILQPLFTRPRYRWRAFWAALFMFAGGVMAKLASGYAALDQALRLFNWPHGQLANFAGLTRWVNEIWPFAALIFLAVAFVSNQPESQ